MSTVAECPAQFDHSLLLIGCLIEETQQVLNRITSGEIPQHQSVIFGQNANLWLEEARKRLGEIRSDAVV